MEIDKNIILNALKKLDVKNDEHWTQDGAPRVDALGIEGVTRQMIVNTAPKFTRNSLNAEQVVLKGVKEHGESIIQKAYDLSGVASSEEWNNLDDQTRNNAISEILIEEATEEDPLVVENEPLTTTGLTELDIAKQQLEQAIAVKVEAQKEEDRLRSIVDKLIEKNTPKVNTTTNQEEITRFIKSQAELREKRAEQQRAYIGKSALDNSMGFRRGRGNQRPQYPSKVV